MTKKKKTADAPKPRHIWEMDPVTRVKVSEKKYSRPKKKAAERKEIDEIIDFFGE